MNAAPNDQPGAGIGADVPTSEPPAQDAAHPGTDPAVGHEPTVRTRRRAWPGALVRGVAVIVVAGVGYQLVVPFTSVHRSRLALLSVDRSGVAGFPGAPSHSGEQPATTGSLSALTTAAKAHPKQTALYVRQWASKSSANSALYVVTFLLPDAATAEKLRSQLVSAQLSPTVFQSSGLVRTGTFTLAGISGLNGSNYGPAKGTPASSAGHVTIDAWRNDAVVSLVELAYEGAANSYADAASVTRAQASHVAAVAPGFTLDVRRYPQTATIVWLAGSFAALLLIALGPVGWRRRQDRIDREYEAELARTIQVGQSRIVRKRQS